MAPLVLDDVSGKHLASFDSTMISAFKTSSRPVAACFGIEAHSSVKLALAKLHCYLSRINQNSSNVSPAPASSTPPARMNSKCMAVELCTVIRPNPNSELMNWRIRERCTEGGRLVTRCKKYKPCRAERGTRKPVLALLFPHLPGPSNRWRTIRPYPNPRRPSRR